MAPPRARFLDSAPSIGVVVFLSGIALALLAPWKVEPMELPAPRIEPRALAAGRAADDLDADAAERTALDRDVRALGSAFRAYGRAEADEDEPALVNARSQITATVAPAERVGEDSVRHLRAYQLRQFLRALGRWEATGEVTDELAELGGSFVATGLRSGWLGIEGDRRRVHVSDAVLRALFTIRWNRVTGVAGAGLRASPRVDERRALLHFLITRPSEPVVAGARRAGRQLPADEQGRLRRIDELAQLDPGYPADIARGVVLYRLGRYPMATEAFRRHLDQHPDGPYALRAMAHLRAALEKARED